MRLVNSSKENISKRHYVFYDFDGKSVEFDCPIDTDDSELRKMLDSKKHCAYSIETEKDTLYFVKLNGSMPFNPQHDSTSYRKLNWQYKKVAEKTFGFYLTYLENRKQRYLKLVEQK